MTERRSHQLEIIAGPCSINNSNMTEVYEIADISTEQGPAIYGTRVVGLKSRTAFDPTGAGMGIDFDALIKNFPHETPPSVAFAQEVVENTGMIVATEIMIPERQMMFYDRHIPDGKLLAWNPSVDQLGWHIMQTAEYAQKKNWSIGIKNGKTLGITLDEANDPNCEKISNAESTWVGLTSYAPGMNEAGQVVLIQRGVDVPDKGLYRNAPIHEIARKVKRKVPGSMMYFDPSHSIGPILRDHILEATVHAMHMRDDNGYLYDGLLIEAGTSDTDTGQHVSLSDLDNLARELTTFRELRQPDHTRRIHTSAMIPRGQEVYIR